MAEVVFVTGGTGRIGRPLLERLVERGETVRALVRSEADERAMRELGVEPIRGDLSDSEALRRGVNRATIVFHLAGGVRGPGLETPDILNHAGTRNLFESARSESQLKSFVFASTVAVYGDRSSLWVEEDFVTSPNTRYGHSKVKAEELLLEAAANNDFPVRIARIAAVYGEGFPFAMVDRMADDKAWLPGEGRNCIPVIHVEDCVGALIAIAESGENGGIYHVADRSSPTLKEFYQAVHKQVGGSAVRFWSTYIPSYVQAFAARGNERLQSRLGTKPKFTPDNLTLYTNSVRVKTDRLEELGFEWRWPEYTLGVASAFGSDGH